MQRWLDFAAWFAELIEGWAGLYAAFMLPLVAATHSPTQHQLHAQVTVTGFLPPIFRLYLIQEYQNIIRIEEQGCNRSQVLFYLLALQKQLSSFKVMVCKNVENRHKLT